MYVFVIIHGNIFVTENVSSQFRQPQYPFIPLQSTIDWSEKWAHSAVSSQQSAISNSAQTNCGWFSFQCSSQALGDPWYMKNDLQDFLNVSITKYKINVQYSSAPRYNLCKYKQQRNESKELLSRNVKYLSKLPVGDSELPVTTMIVLVWAIVLFSSR